MKIGFAGLGVMGAPMAGHLQRAGQQVTGFNRSPDKASAWASAAGGQAAATVAEAAAGAELFILCVGNDHDVRGVVGQALPYLADGAVIVDHTTTSAVVAREMAALAETSGRRFLDALVLGRINGDRKGLVPIESVIHRDAGEHIGVSNVLGVQEIRLRDRHREPMLRTAFARGQNQPVGRLGRIRPELPAKIEVQP